MKPIDLRLVPRWSINNRTLVESSKICGCYHCGAIFTPDCIIGYCDEKNSTVLCPRCGIDTVLGDMTGIPMNVEVLMKIHDYWFKKPAGGVTTSVRR